MKAINNINIKPKFSTSIKSKKTKRKKEKKPRGKYLFKTHENRNYKTPKKRKEEAKKIDFF